MWLKTIFHLTFLKFFIMKAKSFLLNILFFILVITFVGCTSEVTDEEIGIEVNTSVDLDRFMEDKDKIEEPDDRD